MTTFNIASPDQGVTPTTQVNMRSFQFGDGYTQEVADGINFVSSVYNVAFTNRPQATIQSIDDFLIAQAGAPFTWVTPRGTTIRVKCKQWSANYQVSTACSLTATFTQTFEP
jgi:phage-related protein